jgi:hypothetical protein
MNKVAVRADWRDVNGLRLIDVKSYLPYLLLLVLTMAVYWPALRMPPTDRDDLKYLSSVAATRNPLVYFAQDDGVGNNLYRPFMAISLWVAFRLFGVWAAPNHLINLALHFIAACLLFRMALRLCREALVAFLIVTVFLVSPFAATAAIEIFDRPMAAIGILLLLLVDHLAPAGVFETGERMPAVRIAYVVTLLLLAFLTKESGVTLPVFLLLFALAPWSRATLSSRSRVKLWAAALATLLGYFLLRAVVFGYNAAAYEQEGYLFLGLREYEHISDLPVALRFFALAENVVKNLLAPALPIFGFGGRLLNRNELFLAAPVIIATPLLLGLASGRRLSRFQWVSAMILVASALVHAPLFRDRLQYLSQIAVCLYLAASPHLLGRQITGYSINVTRTAALALMAALVLGGTLWIHTELAVSLEGRTRQLSRYAKSLEELPPGIQQGIVIDVLAQYQR